MTEFLEKVEQPELVVRGETSEHIDAPEQTREPECGCDDAVIYSAEIENEVVQNAAGETIVAYGEATLSRAVALSGNTCPETIPPVEPEFELPREKSSKRPTGADAPGLKRHRVITGACIALSVAVFGLSFFDVSGLFEKPGTLNSNLKFTEKNKTNRLPDNLSYVDEQPASEGLRPVRSSSWNDNKVGFADESGNLVVPRNYLQVNQFSDGLAAVRFSGEKSDSKNDSERWGYIDKSGKTVLPAIYTYADDFRKGITSVVINDFGAVIDKKGNIIRKSIEHSAPSRIGNLFSIKDENGFYGMVDATGNYVVPPQYEKIERIGQDPQERYREREYDPDNLVVWLNGRCGLLDPSGKPLIPLNYESISTYNRGYATVMHKGNYGMVDSRGNYLLEPKYKLITMYDDVIAALDHEKNWKLFDAAGKLLPTQIDGAIADGTQPWLNDGMGAVIIGDKCGYVNSKGAVAIQPRYDYAIRFSNGYGLVQQKGLWHYLDKTGNLATKTSFLSAETFKNGKASVAIIGPLYEILNANNLEGQVEHAVDTRRNFQVGEGKT
ncbi:MAG: WG repeat-containing protein [Candidatus Obscuribacterales bacterium]